MSSPRAATSGPDAALARSFARRMAPLAALVGLLVAVAPPLVYELVGRHRLRGRVEAEARSVAEVIGGLAVREPYFWRYNVHKVVGAGSGRPDPDVVVSMRVAGCDGATLVGPEELGLAPRGGGARAWAAISARGRVVAWVQATGAVTALHEQALALGGGSVALGVALGVLLWLVPTGVVRRQGRRLDETVRRLGAAEAALVEANLGLARRVDEAVGEARRLSQRVVSIQEEERARIARDLHDSVGQLLTALQIDLQLARQGGADGPRRLEAALSLAERSLQDLRRVVRDLRPLELEGGGLSGAMGATAERFELRTGIPTSLRHDGPDVADPAAAVCLLRVLQEALANVSRHAGASEVGVGLRVDANRATLQVSDDGRGFDVERARGSGIAGMRERARFLGGSVVVRSAPGEGTTVTAEIPLRADGEDGPEADLAPGG